MRIRRLCVRVAVVSALLAASGGLQLSITARQQTSAGQTLLYGGVGRGSQTNAGRVITIDQATGAGVVKPPSGVSGLTGLAFDTAGTLYGTTISGPLRHGARQHSGSVGPHDGSGDWFADPDYGGRRPDLDYRLGGPTHDRRAVRHRIA